MGEEQTSGTEATGTDTGAQGPNVLETAARNTVDAPKTADWPAKAPESAAPAPDKGKPDGDKAQEGQAGKTAKAQPDAKGKDTKPPEAPAVDASKSVIPLDAEDVETLKKMGLDPSKPDDIAKVVKSYRNAQAEMTRAQQAAKASKVIEDAKAANPKPAQAEAPKSPLDEAEEIHQYMMNNTMALLGVQNEAELRQMYPDVAQRFKDNYVAARQAAWEETQAWKQQQTAKRYEEETKKQSFLREVEAAKASTTTNLQNIRKDYPEFDRDFKATGLSELLGVLETTWAIPREFILHDAKTAETFARLSKALSTQARLPDLQKEWIAGYEKQRKEQQKAKIPSAQQGSPGPVPALEKAAAKSTLGKGVAF